MDSILSKVLATNFKFGNYCNDYNKKVKNNCYGNFISLCKQYDLKEIIIYLKELNLIDDINNISSKMDRSLLYTSFTHGFMHNERVLFFAYVLAKLKKLTDEDLEILMDAAMYHDIARINDYEDDIHGLGAANRIDKVVKNKKIYENEENLNLLKFIIDFHSTKDEMFQVLLENHEIKDKNRAENLAYSLKAADALDRVRITMGKNKSDLNPKFLKIPEAFYLIKVAHQLNELYLSYLNNLNQKDIYKELNEKTGEEIFFHGIGFDFFKLESILENGILSKNILVQKKINTSSNFNGYNFNDYICVACYGDEYYSEKSAMNGFIRNSIAFYITGIDVLEGTLATDLTVAEFFTHDKKKPLKANIMKDERFVKNYISLDKIKGLVIPKSCLNLSLQDLNYMINSHEYKVIEEKVNYFLKNIEKVLGFNLEKTELNAIMENLLSNELNFKKSYVKDVTKYYEQVEIQFLKINKIIGSYFELMYKKLLGKSDIKLIDVMNYTAEKHNLNIEELNDLILFRSEQLILK